MIPFRGYPFSYYGRDRKNVPPVTETPPPQPTPPAFNIPPVTTPPVEVPPTTTPPVETPPVTVTPPVETPPCFIPPVPSQPCMPEMPPFSCMPPQTLPSICPFMSGQMGCNHMGYGQMLPGMYDMGNMDMGNMGSSELMNIPMPTAPGDPPPVLSNNPAIPAVSFFKELTGYPNYGNPSRNADILYTGNRGTWTFDMGLPVAGFGNQSFQLIIRAVLDDHYNVPTNRYSLRISVNDRVVHNGPVNLPHGTPGGTMFNNWVSLSFNLFNIRRNNRIVIENTSTAGSDDWVALDWMELRLVTR